MALVIRRPAGRDGCRHPHFAVVRDAAPCTVGVQIFVAGDFARYVACGDRIVFCAIAAGDPLIERVECRCGTGRPLLQVAADKLDLLTRAHLERTTVTVKRGVTGAQRDHGRTAVGRHIDAEEARARGHERHIRGVDFEVLAGRQRADVRGQRALSDLQLRGRVVQVDDVEGGLLIEAQRGGTRV